jgi:sugar lactone lactonase YvrE
MSTRRSLLGRWCYQGGNAIRRRFRFGALVAAGVFAFLSTTALASDTPVRVLTTAFPNLPESIAIDHTGAMYLSFPFAGEVVKFAPGGSLSTVATVPGIPLGVRLDAEGNVFIAVIQINPEMGKGIWEVPASGGSAFQVASGVGVWNGMAFDHRGNLYVSDTAGGAIWRLAKNGDFTMWSGSSLLKGTTAPGPCGIVGPTVTAGLGSFGANGIFFNKHGDMLVSNTDIGDIVRIPMNPDGSAGTASVFSGPACDLWGADGGAMDNADNLYVAADAINQIVRVDPTGHIQVLAAGYPLNEPSDIAFGTGLGDRTEMFISNDAAFPTFPPSTGAPGVLEMNAGIPGRPIG